MWIDVPWMRITHQSAGHGLPLNYWDIWSSQSPSEHNPPECKIKICDYSLNYPVRPSISIVIDHLKPPHEDKSPRTRISKKNTWLTTPFYKTWFSCYSQEASSYTHVWLHPSQMGRALHHLYRQAILRQPFKGCAKMRIPFHPTYLTDALLQPNSWKTHLLMDAPPTSRAR